MSDDDRALLAIALLHHDYGSPPSRDEEQTVHDVAVGLRDRGHRPTVLTAHRAFPRCSVEDGIRVVRVPRLPELPLRKRGFTGPLTHVPSVITALLRGDYDLAHAFSAPDAYAARQWRERCGNPVVFSCLEMLDRSRVSDRRLRLNLLRHAVEQSDAVVVHSAPAREALSRWMAAEARLIAPTDGEEHERLYQRLRANPGRA